MWRSNDINKHEKNIGHGSKRDKLTSKLYFKNSTYPTYLLRRSIVSVNVSFLLSIVTLLCWILKYNKKFPRQPAQTNKRYSSEHDRSNTALG